MKKQKHEFTVYLCRTVFDYMEDPSQEIQHRHFIGTTYAVSEAQAINNVRFRTGVRDGYDQYQVSWFRAFPKNEDPGAINDWVLA